MIGHSIHDKAALVLQRLGGGAANFAARQLTPKVASSADLVLTMTGAHRDAVLELAPRLLRRTFTLTEASRLASELKAGNVADMAALRPQLAAHDLTDILDPIGQDLEVFEKTGAQIATLLPPVLDLCMHSSSLASD